jgi:protein gp37
MIEAVPSMEGKKRRILIEQVANHMKKLYLLWNKDSVDDEKIFRDIEELSDHKIKVPEDIKLMDMKYLTGKKKKKKK